MIIQCEQCHTKFRLDDAKVTDKGVKVRCAKCKHVFTVYRDEPSEGVESPFGELLENSIGADAVASASVPEPASSSLAATSSAADSIDVSAFDFSAVPEPAAESGTKTEADDFSLSSLGEDDAFTSEAPAADSADFSAFDFGDAVGVTDETVIAPPATPVPPAADETVMQKRPAPAEDDFGGLDFSGDSMFGEAVVQTPEEPTKDISFDLQMDDFAASLGMQKGGASAGERVAVAEPADSPFSLDEIDFGDELTAVAVQQVNPDELKPGQEILFAPLAEATIPPAALSLDTSEQDVPPVAVPAADELPPLSIASRRKQGPATALVAVLGVLIALVAAYFGYQALTGSDKIATSQDTGRIVIRSVQASFVKNKGVGELLVIKGEAVNEFPKPRGAIQVKGMVYGAKGEVLASKNAFCGNSLTAEQLSTMPLEEIEAAMANQFGDSLANMEVLPGKAVPFVVVIAKPPADAKDYGVEATGSTVAAAKQ